VADARGAAGALRVGGAFRAVAFWAVYHKALGGLRSGLGGLMGAGEQLDDLDGFWAKREDDSNHEPQPTNQPTHEPTNRPHLSPAQVRTFLELGPQLLELPDLPEDTRSAWQELM